MLDVGYFMKCRALSLSLILGLVSLSSFAMGSGYYMLGHKATDLPMIDLEDGKVHDLGEFKGAFVVLEWYNPSCPYVQKYYKSDVMQKAQSFAKNKKIHWVRIQVPGFDGHGHVVGSDKNFGLNVDDDNLKSAQINNWIDTKFSVTKYFKVNKFPQIVILNTNNDIVYHGGIDSIRSAKVSDVARAKE